MNRILRFEKCFVPLGESWSHAGVAYRISPWSTARIQRQYGTEWIDVGPAAPVVPLRRPRQGTLSVMPAPMPDAA